MIEALENAYQKLETEFEGLSYEEILQKLKNNPEWRLKIVSLFAEYENAKYFQLICDKLNECKEMSKKKVEQKCVYILEMNNKTVKIGCTKNFKQRMKAISTGSGLNIVNWCYSQNFDSRDAYAFEHMCHEAFQENRIKGEFFDIDFWSAVTELAKYTDKFVTKYDEVEKCQK